MYLMIAYGISSTYYTGSDHQPFQGLVQGNGAAFPGFLLITILLIRSLYSTNLITHSNAPISKVIYQLAGQIFVDDLDFNVMNTGYEDENEIIQRAQRILTTW